MSTPIETLVSDWSREALRELDRAEGGIEGPEVQVSLQRARILRRCARQLAAAIGNASTDTIRRQRSAGEPSTTGHRPRNPAS